MRALINAILTMIIMSMSSAQAITAQEYFDHFNTKEKVRHNAGLVDMANTMYRAQGNKAMGDCIYDMFYGNDKSAELVYSYYDKFRDRQTSQIMYVIIENECGHLK